MRREAEPAATQRSTAVASTLRTIAIVAAVILVVWLLSDVVLLIFLSVVMAVILRGISRWAAHHTGLSEQAMLAPITLFAALAVAGFLYYVAPRLIAQSEELARQIQQEFAQVQNAYGGTTWGRLLLQPAAQPQQVQERIFGYTSTFATSAIWSLATAFIVIVTAIYFAASPELYIGGIVRLFPLAWRGRAERLHYEIGRTLRWWSLGQSIDMLMVGLLTGAGLLLLHLPLALALAFIAGLFTFVPYFGALAAAVPAMVVALTRGWQSAVWVGVVFIVSHLIEGYLISPFVQHRTVRLPPAVTILSMTVLGTIFGPLGIILGTPIAATVLVIVREVYVAGILGDPEVESEMAPDG
ncbi:MAG TPA: AI-2E family transporter [Acetobacteraceae bacterium]|nr:AI-2E family transporter [Acetobacteraceae bacterium]